MPTITDTLRTVFDTVGADSYVREFDRTQRATRKLADEQRRQKEESGELSVRWQSLTSKVLAAGIAFQVAREFIAATAGAINALLTPFAEAEASFVRVSLQMRNLGNVFPTAQLSAFAEGIARLTGFSDELVSELGVLAAQFGLTQEEIKRAIGVSLNVAAGTGKDPRQVLETVIRASRGRAQGLIALGIDPASIKGDIRDINVLLDELARRFGDQAVAAAGTLTGTVGRLKDSVSELAESIGRLFGPRFIPGLELLNRSIQGYTFAFQRLAGLLERLGVLAPLDVNVQRLGQAPVAFKGDPEQTEYQRQIAENTRQTSNAIARQVLGGGPQAQAALNVRGLNAALRARL